MNTLEMMKQVAKGKKYRLPTWADKTARVQKSTDEDIMIVVGQDTPAGNFQILRFMDETDWVELEPKTMFSELEFGEKFIRASLVYTKVSNYNDKKVPHYMDPYFIVYRDVTRNDFEVERVE